MYIRDFKYFHLLLFLTFSACQYSEGILASGDSWEQVINEGTGTLIAYYVPAEGFAYYDDNGNLTGVTVDIIREFNSWIETEYEVELEVQFVSEESFSRFYQTVQNSESGTIGMANVTITEERRQELDFSPSYMQNIAVLITHDSVDELNSFHQIQDQFAGMNALAFEGTLHEQRLGEIREDFFPETNLLMANSNDEIINRVSGDSSLFAYIDIYNYWRASEQGEPLRRHPAGDDAAEEFGYILPPDSDWTPVIKEFFLHGEGYTRSDEFRQIMTRHLGYELAELLLDGS
jgi:ABC-type amino acid transport substrate-binding protein